MRLSEFENLTHLLGKEMLHDEQKLTSSIDPNQFNISLMILNSLNWLSKFREDRFFYLHMKNNISFFGSREISSNL